jgi:host factor-I protein
VAKASTKAPEQTLEEMKYLKSLIERKAPVTVKLVDDQEVSGTLEYYDLAFVRLTREGEPNLFIFKHDIKYLFESAAA